MFRRELRCVACLGLLLALLGPASSLSSVSPATAESPPLTRGTEYTAMKVSPDTTVYLRIDDKGLRVSTTLDGLDGAKTISAKSIDNYFGSGVDGEARQSLYTFTDVSLPVPPGGPGTGWKGAKATFRYYVFKSASSSGSYLSATVTRVCRDASGNTWAYGTGGGVRPASAATQPIPTMQVPALTRPTVKLTATADGRKVAAALRVMCGRTVISDVTCNGKPVRVQMAIMPSGGDPEVIEEGDLTKFGFG